MDKLKTILTTLAVILVALGLLAAVGFIYTLLSYILLFGVLCLAGWIAYRLLAGSKQENLPASKPQGELKKADRILEDYKRKLNS